MEAAASVGHEPPSKNGPHRSDRIVWVYSIGHDRNIYDLNKKRRTKGLSSAVLEAPNFDISSLTNQSITLRQHESVRRFACPVGFFRLKRFCYYLSAGTAPWREAYFHCKDRNATLAILDRNGKDKMLRKYLMGDQFTKLERWIGGIFNWQQMAWEWGVTGEKMVFQSFGKMGESARSKKYAWHCIIMDPVLKYKWSARSCMERKHYICEVPAGRLARRRKKSQDPFAPQNQRLKPRKKGKKYLDEQRKSGERKKNRSNSRRNWLNQGENQQWAHGVKLGSRPPSNMKMMPKERTRHHANRTRVQSTVPRVAQVLPQGREYGAFLANEYHQSQNLADMDNVFSQFHNKINDFAREEILLKP
ncbi:C-type lectin domain family 10 member A [Atta colombica]|uniref:C-type lectin domain family 10 member A n=1 Tax=Atta colombica TaxID=520822 RepID=A0A195BHM3_9HYME|nr:C-type lectin domain family 10 member A [Atta colombica]